MPRSFGARSGKDFAAVVAEEGNQARAAHVARSAHSLTAFAQTGFFMASVPT